MLAHCGAAWLYCDGAMVLGLLILLGLVWWSMKRAERRGRKTRRRS